MATNPRIALGLANQPVRFPTPPAIPASRPIGANIVDAFNEWEKQQAQAEDRAWAREQRGWQREDRQQATYERQRKRDELEDLKSSLFVSMNASDPDTVRQFLTERDPDELVVYDELGHDRYVTQQRNDVELYTRMGVLKAPPAQKAPTITTIRHADGTSQQVRWVDGQPVPVSERFDPNLLGQAAEAQKGRIGAITAANNPANILAAELAAGRAEKQRLEIEGTIAEREAAKRAAETNRVVVQQSAKRVVDSIDQINTILDSKDWRLPATGRGSSLAAIFGAPDATRIRQLVKNVQSNLSLDRLQQMIEQGIRPGNVTETEWPMFASAIATLDPDGPTEGFVEDLKRVQELYTRIAQPGDQSGEDGQDGQGQGAQGAQGGQTEGSTPELPPGARLVTPPGQGQAPTPPGGARVVPGGNPQGAATPANTGAATPVYYRPRTRVARQRYQQWAGPINEAAARYNIDPNLLTAVVEQESAFRPDAVSPAGAIGLGQLMPGTARELGVDPTDPLQNLDGAARYLAGLLERFSGRVDLALAGYNAGPNRRSLREGRIPQISETQNYVRRILSRLAESQKLRGNDVPSQLQRSA